MVILLNYNNLFNMRGRGGGKRKSLAFREKMYSKDRWRNEEKRGTEKGIDYKRKMVEDGGYK